MKTTIPQFKKLLAEALGQLGEMEKEPVLKKPHLGHWPSQGSREREDFGKYILSIIPHDRGSEEYREIAILRKGQGADFVSRDPEIQKSQLLSGLFSADDVAIIDKETLDDVRQELAKLGGVTLGGVGPQMQLPLGAPKK